MMKLPVFLQEWGFVSWSHVGVVAIECLVILVVVLIILKGIKEFLGFTEEL